MNEMGKGDRCCVTLLSVSGDTTAGPTNVTATLRVRVCNDGTEVRFVVSLELRVLVTRHPVPVYIRFRTQHSVAIRIEPDGDVVLILMGYAIDLKDLEGIESASAELAFEEGGEERRLTVDLTPEELNQIKTLRV